MKKFIMVLVCLMTMVAFTSCSKDDDLIDGAEESIVGGWLYSGDDGEVEFYFAIDGTAQIIYRYNGESEYLVNTIYAVVDDKLIYTDVDDYSSDVAYWQNKVNQVKDELTNARGSRRQYLIDLLNQYTENLRKDKMRVQNSNRNIKLTIVSLTKNRMVLESLDKKDRTTLKRIM